MYVGDFLITSIHLKIENLKDKMKDEFENTDLSKLSCFIGMEFMKVKESIMMHQQNHVKELLDRFETSDSNTITNLS